MSNVNVGEFWDSVGGHERTRGRYVVVEPNLEGARESPGSWVMRRLSDGKTAYMHRGARERGEWVRVEAKPASDLSYEGLLRTLGETAADLQETRRALESSREKAVQLEAERDAARAEANGHLSTLELLRYSFGKWGDFASGPEVPPASDGVALVSYVNGLMSRVHARLTELTGERDAAYDSLSAIAAECGVDPKAPRAGVRKLRERAEAAEAIVQQTQGVHVDWVAEAKGLRDQRDELIRGISGVLFAAAESGLKIPTDEEEAAGRTLKEYVREIAQGYKRLREALSHLADAADHALAFEQDCEVPGPYLDELQECAKAARRALKGEGGGDV